jgi:hypothetical protein
MNTTLSTTSVKNEKPIRIVYELTLNAIDDTSLA